MPKAILRILSLIWVALFAPQALPSQGVAAELVVATVVGDSSIQVTWLLHDGPAVVRQELQRLRAGTPYEPLAVVPVGTTSYLDASVRPDDSSYAYRLVTEDINGEVRFSNEGQSMRLRTSRENAGIHLEWRPYVSWAGGVEEYRVYFKSQEVVGAPADDWQLLVTLPSNTNIYLDRSAYLPTAMICYKVEAQEWQGNRAVSSSNESCQLAGLVIPNTFSPNGDGINDRWFIEGLGLYGKISCKVYDRWGREVYQTTFEHFQWDGKPYLGDGDLPDGAYYYTLELEGYDEVFKGYIMLLR